jgi:mannose-6-phosphate isomerase-like protein (cupin superfamily)
LLLGEFMVISLSAAVLGCMLAGGVVGQTAPAAAANGGVAQGSGFDEMTSAQMQAKAAELLAQAKASPAGMASVTLNKYPGHSTMLTVRLKSGGAEQHDHANDIFVVISGEATEITGGTMEGKKEASTPGEFRGTRVVGGTEHVMRAGDVVHISPGVPHQTVVAPGQVFTYFVVKVSE